MKKLSFIVFRTDYLWDCRVNHGPRIRRDGIGVPETEMAGVPGLTSGTAGLISDSGLGLT